MGIAVVFNFSGNKNHWLNNYRNTCQHPSGNYIYVAMWRLFKDSFIYPSCYDKLDKRINTGGKTPTRLAVDLKFCV